MHNDRVIAKITKGQADGSKTEGKLCASWKGPTGGVVGTYEKSRNFGFVVPDDPRILTTFTLPGRMHWVPEGDKVVVNPAVARKRRNPGGEGLSRLGHRAI